MEAKDLMINDLVRSDLGTIYRVKGVRDFDGGEVLVNTGKADIWYQYTLTKPIPLTEEILEKNGFNKHDNCFVYKEYKLEICIEKYEDDNIILSIGHTCNGGYDCVHVRIHHVHELQHALRLFGLGDIANNFKIEAK